MADSHVRKKNRCRPHTFFTHARAHCPISNKPYAPYENRYPTEINTLFFVGSIFQPPKNIPATHTKRALHPRSWEVRTAEAARIAFIHGCCIKSEKPDRVYTRVLYGSDTRSARETRHDRRRTEHRRDHIEARLRISLVLTPANQRDLS